MNYYGFHQRNVSERDDWRRTLLDLPEKGTETDRRFNLHLGDTGEKLEPPP